MATTFLKSSAHHLPRRVGTATTLRLLLTICLSTESLLCDENIRNMLYSQIYIDNLVGLAVDEAHCIDTWLVASMQICM